MTNIESPSDQRRIKQVVRRRRIFRKEKEKYEEDQEEDEEKEEEDEYANYSKMKGK
jgi:hypothetical protein